MNNFKKITMLITLIAFNSIWAMKKELKEATGIDLELIEAVKNNKYEEVKSLISKGANIYCYDHILSGRTPLIYACGRAHYEIAKLLLDNGAAESIDSYNRDYRNALLETIHYASHPNEPMHQQYINTIKLLISYGADINSNKGCETALHIAIEKNYNEIAKILIENKADVNIKDYNFYTPLIHAIKKNNIEIVKYLIKAGADLNQTGCRFVGNSILQEGKHVPIIIAVEESNSEIVNLLIEAGANINKKGQDDKSVYEVAKESIDYYKTTTRFESEKENCEKICLLIENYIRNINQLLIKAIYDYDFANFKKNLLIIGSIFTLDENKNNLLHHALKAKNFKVIKYILLFKHVKANYYSNNKCLWLQQNKEKQIPFEFCEDLKNFEFKREGAGHIYNYCDNIIELKDFKSNNLLHIFISLYSNDLSEIQKQDLFELIVELITEKPSLVAEKNNLGLTPITYSLQNNKLEIFKYLIAKLYKDNNEINFQNLNIQEPVLKKQKIENKIGKK